MDQYLMIGTVLKPQGIRGELKIRSYAAKVELFHQWNTLYMKKDEQYLPVAVAVKRIRDGYVYASLDGSSTADEAERFRGADLYVHRDHASPPGKHANLIADLIGCRAVDESGHELGTLTEVLQYGSVDTWVFKTDSGLLMSPALKAVFPEVLPAEKLIRVVAEKLEEVAVRT